MIDDAQLACKMVGYEIWSSVISDGSFSEELGLHERVSGA